MNGLKVLVFERGTLLSCSVALCHAVQRGLLLAFEGRKLKHD